MAVQSYTHRDGRLRFLDGSAVPYYIEIPFVNADFTGPLGRPRQEQTPVLDRGRLSSLMHYMEGPDDPILSPVNISWSFRMLNTEPTYTKFRAALNIDQGATWTVGGNTWVSTKGTTQLLSGGKTPSLYTTPSFANAPRRRTVNVEVLFVDPSSTQDVGLRYAETYFDPAQQNIREGDNEITINCTGICYGAITQITAFTAATAG